MRPEIANTCASLTCMGMQFSIASKVLGAQLIWHPTTGMLHMCLIGRPWAETITRHLMQQSSFLNNLTSLDPLSQCLWLETMHAQGSLTCRMHIPWVDTSNRSAQEHWVA